MALPAGVPRRSRAAAGPPLTSERCTSKDMPINEPQDRTANRKSGHRNHQNDIAVTFESGRSAHVSNEDNRRIMNDDVSARNCQESSKEDLEFKRRRMGMTVKSPIRGTSRSDRNMSEGVLASDNDFDVPTGSNEDGKYALERPPHEGSRPNPRENDSSSLDAIGKGTSNHMEANSHHEEHADGNNTGDGQTNGVRRNHEEQRRSDDQEHPQQHTSDDPDWESICRHDPASRDVPVFLAARERREAAEKRFADALDECHHVLNRSVESILQAAAEIYDLRRDGLLSMEETLKADFASNDEARDAMERKLQDSAEAAQGLFANLLMRVSHPLGAAAAVLKQSETSESQGAKRDSS